MMTKEEIVKMVSSYIEQSLGGLSLENSKFDFKRKWYDLNSEMGIQEFIKDTTSMVNTYGPDGIILIGFDDKTKEFEESRVSKDPSDIINLVNKRVDRLFDLNTFDILYNGHSLSVIHIPPSMDKPHLIRNYQTFHKDGGVKNSYQNISLVRKNTRTDFSTRYDLDLMLWDNRNVVPDFRILSSYHIESIVFRQLGEDTPKCEIFLTLENTGKRPVGIVSMRIKFKLFQDSYTHEEIEFVINSKQFNIIIPPGSIWNKDVVMMSSSHLDKTTSMKLVEEFNLSKKTLISNPLQIKLSTGKTIESELIQNS